ncbi:hypothetical protein DFH06DRAFT_275022 [Mycena polygramma]|nr:hypothetical protein DFH06DRAFT_275022 [Mycena polygramma]
MNSLTPSHHVSEKGRPPTETDLTVKLICIHAVHGLLVAVHVAALVAAVKVWHIPLGLRNFALVQTGVTAGLQLTFLIIIGGLVSLVREIAVDANIRHRPFRFVVILAGSLICSSPDSWAAASPTESLVWLIFLSFRELALHTVSIFTAGPITDAVGCTRLETDPGLLCLLHPLADQQRIDFRDHFRGRANPFHRIRGV